MDDDKALALYAKLKATEKALVETRARLRSIELILLPVTAVLAKANPQIRALPAALRSSAAKFRENGDPVMAEEMEKHAGWLADGLEKA